MCVRWRLSFSRSKTLTPLDPKCRKFVPHPLLWVGKNYPAPQNTKHHHHFSFHAFNLPSVLTIKYQTVAYFSFHFPPISSFLPFTCFPLVASSSTHRSIRHLPIQIYALSLLLIKLAYSWSFIQIEKNKALAELLQRTSGKNRGTYKYACNPSPPPTHTLTHPCTHTDNYQTVGVIEYHASGCLEVWNEETDNPAPGDTY